MSRKWTTAGIAAVLVAAGAGGYVYLSGTAGNDAGAQASNDLPAATADVTKQTLLDKETHDGSLEYADATTIKTKLSGTVTALAAVGSTVNRGQRLYKIDNKPVVLLYGSMPAYRALSSGSKGTDVLQFEKNLWALGYRGFTVDKDYTSSTAAAVKDWQEDLGLSRTGKLELGRVFYATGALRVDSLAADLDDSVQPGSQMLQVSGMGRVATIQLGIDDQRLAKMGSTVDVTLPDGRKVKGKITKVATVVKAAQTAGQEATTQIDLTISFSKTPTGLDEAAVSIDFTVNQVKDVLTVPVNALLALSEGGYGLQVVEGGTSKIVAVQTGLFADGRVEVSGGGIAEGMKVGVPE